MNNRPIATFDDVCDASLVQKAELGKQLLAQLGAGEPTGGVVRAVLNLGHGVEQVAKSPSAPERADLQAYLIETYGLFAIGTDPFLRPLLPPIPASGATVRSRYRMVNGHLSIANGQYITAGAVLAPASSSPDSLS